MRAEEDFRPVVDILGSWVKRSKNPLSAHELLQKSRHVMTPPEEL
jgi:hypothetical protein